MPTAPEPTGAEPDSGAAALLGPVEVRRLADELGLRPTKRLGQNFVHDPNTVRRIARLARLTGDDIVLEIGPGLGSLTLALLADPALARVVAVEIDPRLAAVLPATVARRAPEAASRLRVLTLDALRLRATDLVADAGGPTALVANLPYNVAVPVLLTALAELPTLRRGLVMVQSEVVDRLAAAPGSRAYGTPSVKLAWYAAAHRAGPVPRAVFWPVPGVDSALLAFTRREPPAGGRRDDTFRLVDAAFAQRRKALRSALAGVYGGPGAAAAALREADLDPMCRAERLSVTDFSRLAGRCPPPTVPAATSASAPADPVAAPSRTPPPSELSPPSEVDRATRPAPPSRPPPTQLG